MKREPEELDVLRSGVNLGLLAKHIVDGFMIGMHKGTRRGIGSEFSQYRSYQPGDDIRQIDWKMFARSDRYYIKESETESSVTVRFFLDMSASMKYEENGITRFQYATLVTAVLATIASQQGDAVALHLVNNEEHRSLSEKRGKAHLNRFIHLLENVNCKGHWPESTDWLTDNLNAYSRELWIVCSDLLDGEQRWETFIQLSKSVGHEIQFLQILGYDELHLEIEEAVTVEDPESHATKNIRTSAVREKYLQNLHAYLEELKTGLLSPRTNLFTMQMNQPVRDALFEFLKLRERL
jgi:uncharacterized protein (DUF58 family)